MLLQGWSSSSGLLLPPRRCSHLPPYNPKTTSSSSLKSATIVKVVRASLRINEFAEIVHNKVLIAAAASAAIGQLSKPFTSTFLYGNRSTDNFDFIKAAFRAGGFPSTHSSAAVATAMSLGIERGFSDAIFGLAVVYASLVMYDAQAEIYTVLVKIESEAMLAINNYQIRDQKCHATIRRATALNPRPFGEGVRREVGIHAKALNSVLVQKFIPLKDVDDMMESRPRISFSKQENFKPMSLEEADSFSLKHRNAKILLASENRKDQIGKLSSSSPASDAEGETEKVISCDVPVLKESVGHNEFEVIAGALLGLLVCLAVYDIP